MSWSRVALRTPSLASSLVLVALALAPPASAQTTWNPGGQPSVLVVPQQRVFAIGGQPAAVHIASVDAGVTVMGQVATIVLRLDLRNNSQLVEQAQLLVPVPDGAVVRGFDFQGAATAPTARLLDRGQARAEYESIVSRARDPALLEFAGRGMIQSSVFPVPPGGKQAVTVTYEQVLPRQGARVDFVLPRSDMAGYAAVPWRIGVRIKAGRPVTTLYSPSHEFSLLRLHADTVFVETVEASRRVPGSFLLSWVEGDGPAGDVAGSVLACPEESGQGGHFLLLAGAPAPAPDATVSREVTLVIDRSGSMAGGKIEQARAAALQVLEGLREWETFNVIDYSDDVARFAEAPLLRTSENLARARAYVQGLSAHGGTNIHAALLAAAAQPARDGFLPVVLFLTDGLPTVGVSDEARIRADFAAANAHHRRLFAFGVGDDVNAPLLDGLAASTRATSTYVHPGEDVEAKVGDVYKRLYGPVLAEPTLAVLDETGQPDTLLVRDLQPATLPDIYSEDQLVVLGRYLGPRSVRFRLDGRTAQGPRSWEFTLDPAQASRESAFVPRLWAAREIGALVDEVRQAGAVPGQQPADARMRELVEEIVALSTHYGVLTEYTAFMATEGTDLSDTDQLTARVRALLQGRAAGDRTGRGAVSQAVNLRRLQAAQRDRSGSYLDRDLKRIKVASVQQVDDLTLFRIGPRWVDGRLVALSRHDRALQLSLPPGAPAEALAAREAGLKNTSAESAPAGGAALAPDVPRFDVVSFGTPEYFALAERLAGEGRPGVLALRAELYLLVGERPTLVLAPQTDAVAAPAG